MSISQNDEKHIFKLDKLFVKKYEDIEPPFGFNGLGKFVYERTYARVKPDGTTEEWFEAVERIVNGTYTMQKTHVINNELSWDDEKATESAKIMYDKIFNFKFTPPGRGLWSMGTSATDKNGYACLNNCAFVSTSAVKTVLSKPFRFLMDQCMLGVGVGFDVAGANTIMINAPNGSEITEPSVHVAYSLLESFESAVNFIKDIIAKTTEHIAAEPEKSFKRDVYIADLAKYKRELEWILTLNIENVQIYKIQDTREGWVDSVGVLLESYMYMHKRPIIFDYSAIRLAGVPLKTFGGLASGPDPLFDLHIDVRAVLNKNANSLLTITTITDIMNLIGKAVVAGNVRRCLPKGTKVHVKQNGIFKMVNIEEVTKDMEAVMCAYDENGKQIIKTGQIIDLVKNTQYVFTLKTEIGNIKTAVNHEFAHSKFLKNYHDNPEEQFARDADGKLLPVKYKWIPAVFLTSGDEVVLSIHDNYYNTAPNVTKEEMYSPEYKTKIYEFMKKHKLLVNDKVKNGLYRVKITEDPPRGIELAAHTEECVDITVAGISSFVVEQGFITHNSSEISLGPISNDEFLNLKNYEKNPDRAGHGWLSNNTVVITNDDLPLSSIYNKAAAMTKQNGEPGYFWIDNARNYSRMGDHAPDYRDMKIEGTNPCSEISLESYELCCLVECYMARASSIDEFLETLKYAYLYTKTVTLGKSNWEETNRVIMRNRRIGCSLTGIVQFLANHNNNNDYLKDWLIRGYDTIQKYDRIYSDWFGIPLSIKTTTVKPSGCLTPDTLIKTISNGEIANKSLGAIFQEAANYDLYSENNKNTYEKNTSEKNTSTESNKHHPLKTGKWIEPKKQINVLDENGNPTAITKLFVRAVPENKTQHVHKNWSLPTHRAYKITFEDNSTVVCSPEHKLLVSADGLREFVPAERLAKNMKITTNK